MAKSSAKRRKVAKHEIENDEEYNKSKTMANSFSKKFKTKKLTDTVPTFQTSSSGAATIKNSENHNSAVARAQDYHHSRIFQWEPEEAAIEGAYLCAFCHDGVHRDEMGELFGPYYLKNFAVGKYWPGFLAKKPSKKAADLEIWFHGECVLWAPGIYLSGNTLENLDEKMEQFWSQSCDVCKKNGAQIPILNRNQHFVHYKCAKDGDFVLDEQNLTCHHL
ncbi:unnamed protein product [Caenorhabditis angaria]|uniref:PHD-type domain-containing protein n=1 Tax=Caenorhabditis angaria TaxID=860376 RepID=A0A9P1N4Q1_9PELO|nr:unnamed protein product [Caenorhabditis angaria]